MNATLLRLADTIDQLVSESIRSHEWERSRRALLNAASVTANGQLRGQCRAKLNWKNKTNIAGTMMVTIVIGLFTEWRHSATRKSMCAGSHTRKHTLGIFKFKIIPRYGRIIIHASHFVIFRLYKQESLEDSSATSVKNSQYLKIPIISQRWNLHNDVTLCCRLHFTKGTPSKHINLVTNRWCVIKENELGPDGTPMTENAVESCAQRIISVKIKFDYVQKFYCCNKYLYDEDILGNKFFAIFFSNFRNPLPSFVH